MLLLPAAFIVSWMFDMSYDFERGFIAGGMFAYTVAIVWLMKNDRR